MSKASRMARTSTKGGLNLFWGLVVSTIISAVGFIIAARLLSPSEYGLVSITLIAPALISLFRDWGISSAMIKYVAQYKGEGKEEDARNIITVGLAFESILGASLSAVSFILSDFIATSVFQRPIMRPLIEIASFTIFTEALNTATQSAFTGYERMELRSITMICQALLKTVLMVLLIAIGLGAFGAVLGATLASLGAGLISTVILYIALYRNLHKSKDAKLRIMETAKAMFGFGLPLSIAFILNNSLIQFYNFLVAIYCEDLLIGNYKVATNFIVLITFFATPISTVLFPAFSQIDQRRESGTLRNVFQISVKYTTLVILPATMIIMSLSQPAVSTIFGEKYSYAPLYLALSAIEYLYSALGSLSLESLIASQGKTQTILKLTLISCTVGLPVSMILVPKLGIVGLIATSLVAKAPNLVAGLWWVKRNFAFTIDWVSSSKILLASSLAATVTYTTSSLLILPDWVRLVVGTAAFIALYAITLLLTSAINKTDIQNVKEAIRDLGPMTQLFNPPLDTLEKLVSLLQKQESNH